MFSRLKAAARVLLKGEARRRGRLSIPPITTEEVAEVRQFFGRPKFFVLGHARSGTTLLMRLIRLHPEVHCSYQAHFFTRRPLLKSLVNSPEAEEWLTRRSNRWNHGRDLSPLMLRAAADVILEREAAREGKPIVGDKSPSSSIHGEAVRDMHAVYPDASLIYIIRDGRDVAVSERFRNLVEESKFLSAEDRRIMARLTQDPAAFADGRRSIFTQAFIRRLASQWAQDVTEICGEGRRLYGERFLALRYEDMLRQPFSELSRCWAFLGVNAVDSGLDRSLSEELASNPDEDWQAERGQDLAGLLPKGQAGNWRRLFTASDQQVFELIAGPVLRDWGYAHTP